MIAGCDEELIGAPFARHREERGPHGGAADRAPAFELADEPPPKNRRGSHGS